MYGSSPFDFVMGKAMLDPRLLARLRRHPRRPGASPAPPSGCNMTQSTISQQLRPPRGRASATPLVDRDARPLERHPRGRAPARLRPARPRASAATRPPPRSATPPAPPPIRIGLPEDILTLARWPALFRDFVPRRTARHPARRRRRRSAASSPAATAPVELDIAVVEEAGRPAPTARASFPEPMAWVEAAGRPRLARPDPARGLPARRALPRPGDRSASSASGGAGTSPSRWHQPRRRAGGGRGRPRRHPPAGRHHRRRVRPFAPFGAEPAIAASLYAWERTGPIEALTARMTAALAERAAAGLISHRTFSANPEDASPGMRAGQETGEEIHHRAGTDRNGAGARWRRATPQRQGPSAPPTLEEAAHGHSHPSRRRDAAGAEAVHARPAARARHVRRRHRRAADHRPGAAAPARGRRLPDLRRPVLLRRRLDPAVARRHALVRRAHAGDDGRHLRLGRADGVDRADPSRAPRGRG